MSRLLAFFLRGEGKFLEDTLDAGNAIYAAQLVFSELTLYPHKGKMWDRILDRHDWILGEGGAFYFGAWPEPLNRKRLDALWTLRRLDACIQDLASGDTQAVSNAIREIRVFSGLRRIPESRKVALRKATEVALRSALTAQEDEQIIHLVRLMEARIISSSVFTSFFWKVAKDPSAAVRAQILLVNPDHYPDLPSQKRWRELLFSSYEDADPQVVQATLIAFAKTFPEGLDDEEMAKKIATRALQVLQVVPVTTFHTRLFFSCILILSTFSYGDENPSAAAWLRILSPFLKYNEAMLRRALPALVLHRFPRSSAAQGILASLARDKEKLIRLEALTHIQCLDLRPQDLAWLKILFSEQDPLVQALIVSSVLRASGQQLDVETTEVLLKWVKRQVQRAEKNGDPALVYFLRTISDAEILPRSYLPLILSVLRSKDKGLLWPARVALAAHGLLPDSQVEVLKSILRKTEKWERNEIVTCLYLQALKQGGSSEASLLLDDILEDVVENNAIIAPFPEAWPTIWFALRAGKATEEQKQKMAMRLFDPGLNRQKMALRLFAPLLNRQWGLWSREKWRLCASLGETLRPYRGILEARLKTEKAVVRSKKWRWFESQKAVEGLTLLLESLAG